MILDKSNEIWSRAEKVTPGGVHSSQRNVDPRLVFTKASGAYIWDADGNRYTDYHAAFGPMILGHTHPTVTRRVQEAIAKTDLYGVGVTELELALSEKICAHVPSAQKVLLCNSGSEATFQALRLARAVTGRQKIIKFQGCYHGWHDSVLRNMLSGPERIGTRDPGSLGMLEASIDATLVCTYNDLENVEQTLKAHPGEVAAIIIEPIPHNIGCVMPEVGFLEGLRSLCDQHGTVLVFDEVVTGFRHGIGGYQAIAGVTPDLTAMGKAIANGYPLAALAGRREFMECFNTRPDGKVFFAGTYNGHAVGTSAALATIEIMENEPVHEHVFALGEQMRAGLREIVERLGIRATVAGFGSIYVLYFLDGPIRNYSDLMRNDAAMFIRYRQGLIRRGVYEIPLNIKRCHLSYSHTVADVDNTLQAAEDSLRELLRA
jgi:glutamate-1-semialdehyde 2,1-aminomutase